MLIKKTNINTHQKNQKIKIILCFFECTKDSKISCVKNNMLSTFAVQASWIQGDFAKIIFCRLLFDEFKDYFIKKIFDSLKKVYLSGDREEKNSRLFEF
ncbi:hypothetical protein FACS189449_04520 [Alphaproteobacteria bacterium]|nr:hypothetical protein FACS189449_04520 [Alphaproteobacteria bacterium]